MSLLGNAAVAIWQDAPPEARAEYFEWHNREHMPERVGIPGFLRGRRYCALEGEPEFFTLYEAESLAALTGPDYTARLDNPTAWTRRVAPQLKNNVRSLCNVALSLGSGLGGLVMTWRYDVASGSEAEHHRVVEERLRAIAARPGVVGAHLCIADIAASSVQTAEKRARPTKALTPGWVVIVEGGAERAALGDACAEVLPEATLVQAGALRLATGLYQLQYMPTIT